MASSVSWLALVANLLAQGPTPAEPAPPTTAPAVLAPVRRDAVLVVVPSGPPRPAVVQKTRRSLEALLGATRNLDLKQPPRKATAKLKAITKRCAAASSAVCAKDVAAVTRAKVVVLVRAATAGRNIDVTLEVIEASSGAVLASAKGVTRTGGAAELDPLVGTLDTALNAPPPRQATPHDEALAALPLEPPAPPGEPTGAPATETSVPPEPAAPPLAPVPPPEPTSPALAAAPAVAPPAPPDGPPAATGVAAVEAPTPPADEWPVDEGDPTALHAQAQLDALDGKVDAAKRRLRAALQRAPDDEVIAYDLAALAVRHRDADSQTDAAPFLALAPTPQLAPLQATVRGALAGPSPTSNLADASSLRVQHLAAADTRSSWSARAGVGAQIDTNVTVLPDGSSEDGAVTTSARPVRGVRALVDATLGFSPLRGDTTLEASLKLSVASQLTERQRLDGPMQELLDVGNGGVSLRLRQKLGAAALTIEGVSSAVFLDKMSQLFMVDGGLRVDWRYALGALSVGAYGSGIMRDFRDTPGAEDSDRDGPRSEGGILIGLRVKPVTLVGKAGGQWERTQGVTQREAGLRGSLSASLKLGALDVGVDGSYERRDYYEIARRDQRITPSARLAYELDEHISLYGSYALVQNASRHDLYRYHRHLGTAGVQASW